MRQLAVVLLAVLMTGWSGSSLAAPNNKTSIADSLESTSDADPGLDRAMTEEEFLSSLLQPTSPAVLSLQENLGPRRAALMKAKIYDEPGLSVTREDLGSDGAETEAVASWRLPRTDRRRLAVGSASERLAAAESAYAQSYLNLRLDLRQIYAEWALAAERVEIFSDETALLRTLTRRSEERSRAGEVSGFETRRLRLAELAASSRVAVARSELAASLGAIQAWQPQVVDSHRPVLPELPPAMAADPSIVPAVAELEAELRAAELEKKLATKIAQMPELTLGWKHVSGDGLSPSFDGPILGLKWTVPLPNRGRAELLIAEANSQAAAAKLDLLRRRLEAEHSSALAAYRGLRKAFLEAAEAMSDAEPMMAAARTSFRLGESDLTTLLDAVRTVAAARLSVLELRSQALARHRDLERVRGRSLMPDNDLPAGSLAALAPPLNTRRNNP